MEGETTGQGPSHDVAYDLNRNGAKDQCADAPKSTSLDSFFDRASRGLSAERRLLDRRAALAKRIAITPDAEAILSIVEEACKLGIIDLRELQLQADRTRRARGQL